MKIKWVPDAKASMRQITCYINGRFGRVARQDFLLKVKDTEKRLLLLPNIGIVDPLFADRTIPYRSIIINGLSKMVYYIDGETIYIAAFWDTRREPKKQAQQVKD